MRKIMRTKASGLTSSALYAICLSYRKQLIAALQGVTLTELIQGLIDSGRPELSVDHTLARVYMKRFGLPDEMAATSRSPTSLALHRMLSSATVAFMIGPDSAYMSGQALVVDGVWSP